MQSQDIEREIAASIKSIEDEVEDMPRGGGTIAYLWYCLQKVREIIKDLREFEQRIKAAGPSALQTEALQLELVDLVVVSKKASDLAELHERVMNSQDKIGKEIMEKIKRWYMNELLKVMPGICGAIKIQSWSFGSQFGLQIALGAAK